MTDRLIRITTALAVVAVAVVAASISHQHAYELVRSHGESGMTARLLPFTVDGLIWAASMAVLDASRRNQPVPQLAAWSLGTGIVATVGANLAHGVGHGPIGALVSAWPALALVGSFEMLMMLIRAGRGTRTGEAEPSAPHRPVQPLIQEVPPELAVAPTLEQTVRARHEAGHSQRAIAREFNIDRRKVKHILDQRPNSEKPILRSGPGQNIPGPTSACSITSQVVTWVFRVLHGDAASFPGMPGGPPPLARGRQRPAPDRAGHRRTTPARAGPTVSTLLLAGLCYGPPPLARGRRRTATIN